MRDFSSMSVVMRERERPSPKVWQPWYMEEAEGGGKELPSRAQREQRARERLTIPRPPQLSSHASNSPGCTSDEEEDEINVVDSPPPPTTPAHYTHFYTLHMDDDMDERPLDMSTKRRSPTPTNNTPTHTRPHIHAHNSPSPPPYHPRPNYLPRPSVITCVPPKYASTPPHAHRDRPLPPPYSVATALLSQQRAAQMTPKDAPVSAIARHVMQADPVDPEIDEHFRRSLGQDYHHLFAASVGHADPSTDSVDDHFAKALGETWTKLQAERKDVSSNSSSTTTTTPSTTTSSSSSSSSTLNRASGGGDTGEGGGGGGGGEEDVRRNSLASSTPMNAPPRLIST